MKDVHELVKVRPLEFEESVTDWFSAYAAGCSYEYWLAADGRWYTQRKQCHGYATKEEAKSACQQRYESHIYVMLEAKECATQETDEQLRARFEAWLLREHLLSSEWQPERNCYKDFAAHLTWLAFQAGARRDNESAN